PVDLFPTSNPSSTCGDPPSHFSISSDSCDDGDDENDGGETVSSFRSSDKGENKDESDNKPTTQVLTVENTGKRSKFPLTGVCLPKTYITFTRDFTDDEDLATTSCLSDTASDDLEPQKTKQSLFYRNKSVSRG